MSINRYRLNHLVKKKNKKALKVLNLLKHPEKLLSVILIGSTLANIIASTLATLIGQKLYGQIGVAIATVILTTMILIFAELLPKTLAALYPQQVAFFSVNILVAIQYLLTPIIHSASYATNMILRCFGIKLDHDQKEMLSNEELRSVLLETGNFLRIEDKTMLISLLELEKATVEDIMIPKAEIMGIDLNDDWQNILKKLATNQHTRIVVFEGEIDKIIGWIHVREAMHLLLADNLSLETLKKIIIRPYFVPEGTPLNIQLLKFQQTKNRSSFVVNEYGDLLGLVTLEDILEEIIGEFTTDFAAFSKDLIKKDESGALIIDASITVKHLNRLLNWNIPLAGPKTLSGFIIDTLEYIPPAECCLAVHGHYLEILKVDNNKIKAVKIINKSHSESRQADNHGV